MCKRTIILLISMILLIFSLSFTGTLVFATRITLKDGDIIIGEIKQKKIPFQAKIGSIEIKVTQIVIFKEGKLQLRDGTTIIGTLSGDPLNISTSWGGEIACNLQDISEISCESSVAKPVVKDTQHTSPNPAIHSYTPPPPQRKQYRAKPQI